MNEIEPPPGWVKLTEPHTIDATHVNWINFMAAFGHGPCSHPRWFPLRTTENTTIGYQCLECGRIELKAAQ